MSVFNSEDADRDQWPGEGAARRRNRLDISRATDDELRSELRTLSVQGESIDGEGLGWRREIEREIQSRFTRAGFR